MGKIIQILNEMLKYIENKKANSKREIHNLGGKKVQKGK